MNVKPLVAAERLDERKKRMLITVLEDRLNRKLQRKRSIAEPSHQKRHEIKKKRTNCHESGLARDFTCYPGRSRTARRYTKEGKQIEVAQLGDKS